MDWIECFENGGFHSKLTLDGCGVRLKHFRLERFIEHLYHISSRVKPDPHSPMDAETPQAPPWKTPPYLPPPAKPGHTTRSVGR
ncbi:hypothetical protein Y1Q_0011828 [Alligator mississippiensis]|uniref:Uncharacterized protein n=1 Tax=Alligator mississippiensis TaxID=8496 RepID=A0A151LYK8_ALLMI|nr:hypothetical protein Y1Q_0011828 [Alligator mississippiensis]